MRISFYVMKDSEGNVVGVAAKPRPASLGSKEKVILTETTKANFAKTLKALTQ